MSNSGPGSRLPLVAAAAVAVALIAGLAWQTLRGPALPGPVDAVYEETTRAFYHGLSALEVGLLDDARQQFTRATELVDREPASWVNLGVTQLRLGELDAAAAPIARALSLAPADAGVVLVAGRMEIARGRIDEGIALLRRAADLDPQALRPRFALADEVARSGAVDADAAAQAIFDDLARLAPGNLAVLVERARLAARRRDAQRLAGAVEGLSNRGDGWPPIVTQQFAALQSAAAGGDFDGAARAVVPLRNVLTSIAEFREDLALVQTPTELIAEPIPRFLALAPASAQPSPLDATLAFEAAPLATPAGAPAVLLAFMPGLEGRPAILGATATSVARLDSGAAVWPYPSDAAAAPTAHGVLALDWNHDFRTDVLLAGRGGVRLLLQQEDATWADATATATGGSPLGRCDCFGAWAADVEMDGDLDVVLAPRTGAPVVLRNNGNGTWTETMPFAGVTDVRGFAWADLDRDADPDAAFLAASGRVFVAANRQAGRFAVPGDVPLADVAALTIADVDADGRFDLVALDAAGRVQRASRTGESWSVSTLAEWPGLAGAAPGSHRLFAADLDNSGALDLLASGNGAARVWLADERYQFTALAAAPAGDVYGVLDLNGDGRLDLLAAAAGGAVRLLGRGDAAYHWKVVRAQAQQNAGDQRINAFGVGGDLEVRSGLLLQKHVLTGEPVHIGLGSRTAIDVARIVWPNGVAQAEFGVSVDDAFVAEQRLKGSCPWVFAWDGTRMQFVTDFLWRSPLGLRINAQDTAGVGQTEDWVRISGEQLVPANGSYDLRITAELWETHFFDHVSLMVVDHPADTEVFVDERFSPASPPRLAVQAVRGVRPAVRAIDERGADVTALVARRDGRYLATFDRGAYQGIAADHFVEVETDTGGDARLLVANGWIYPTDSSINVAIGQGGHVQPKGVAVDVQDAAGNWRELHADIGFPAGKNKTILVDLRGAAAARRVRLRTNLEIYWDSIAFAVPTEEAVQVTRLPAAEADLAYRGFSTTTSPRGEGPETPDYDRLAATGQRWRDLVGYHTRFGDVIELLREVDDRYVIMNAGDEMRLRFAEQQPPPDGWRRDFVLVGDGWEKDGDYNTGYSQTVLPLPSHDNPAYRAASESLALEDDPVYQRHRADWERFHTRFVAPDAFVSGLRRAAAGAER